MREKAAHTSATRKAHTWQSDLNNSERANTFNPAAQPPNQPEENIAKMRGSETRILRRPHKPEVVGSNPTPASNYYDHIKDGRGKKPGCPACGGSRVWKYGRDPKGRQLLLCRDCRSRFPVKGNVTLESLEGFDSVHEFPDGVVSFSCKKPFDQVSFMLSEDIGSHKLSIVEKELNTLPSYNRQLGTEMSQQASTTETNQGKQSEKSEQILKGQLVGFVFHLQKLNMDKKTIENNANNIQVLHREGADLSSPDSVITVLATSQKWKQSTKRVYFASYKTFAKWMKITLPDDLPKFKKEAELFYLPSSTQLDVLIAGCGWMTSSFLQVLKETGARSCEASRLQWIDIDAKSQTITIRIPAKGGLPRVVQVSEKLIQMLSRLPHVGDYVFGETPDRIQYRLRTNFHNSRIRLANKTNDKNLLRVHLHSFRHYFASRLYQETHDLRYVQKKMGHRNIKNTEIYENSQPSLDVKSYVSKVATSDQEKMDLLNLGYENTGITTSEGQPILRRKVIGFD